MPRDCAAIVLSVSSQQSVINGRPLFSFIAAAAGRFAAFLLCCPQRSARETTAGLQPRRPFFFLSRKKEKVGGKKKESFAYGKRRNAVRCLRRGKRRFILPTITKRFNPHCRCAALHNIEC